MGQLDERQPQQAAGAYPGRTATVRVLVRLSRVRRSVALVVAVALLAALAVVDAATGPTLTLSIFYVLPVIAVAAAWGAGPATVAFAVTTAIVWTVVDDLLRGQLGGLWSLGFSGVIRLGLLLLLVALVVALLRDLRALQQLSGTDALTQVHNRRSFVAALESELARAGRTGGPVTVAYVDIDDFKRINDTLGHAVGDEVLREVARILTRQTRTQDVVGRLGGDEFAVLLTDLDPEHAPAALERIRRRLDEPARRGDRPAIRCSVGAVTFAHPAGSAEDVLAAADAAMYRAKRGRGAVVVHDVVLDGTQDRHVIPAAEVTPNDAPRGRGPAR